MQTPSTLRRAMAASGAGRGIVKAVVSMAVLSIAVLVVLLGVSIGFVGAARAETAPGGKLALVIANAAYADRRLKTPPGDARLMADALKGLGFSVMRSDNPPRAALLAAIQAFRQRVQPGTVAVVYYSGAALQVAKRNYLLPVDAVPGTSSEAARLGIPLASLYEGLDARAGGARIAILDAARLNPVEQDFRGFSAGLAAAEASEGGLVALSAAPGKLAPEEAGDTDRFTRAVAAALGKPAASLEASLEAARDAVSAATEKAQVPFIASRLADGFSLRAPAGVGAASAAGDAVEIVFWESIRDSRNPADFKAYLTAFPHGRFAALARTRAGNGADDGTPAPGGGESRGVAVIPAAPPVAAGGGAPPPSMRDCAHCPDLVVVAPGSFIMGAADGQPFERPPHPVQIATPFALGRTEVTFGQWDDCVAGGGCSFKPDDRGWGRGARPVINVSWNDARQYVDWLSATTGRRYRLPTEAEWEFAARGGTRTAYWWGASTGVDRANCRGCGGGAGPSRTTEAGAFPPNPLGFVDMAGNAAEWVEDCWHDGFKGAPADGSAWTGTACQERVLRGGSFANDATYVRSASRFHYDADVRYYANGFRVAREAP